MGLIAPDNPADRPLFALADRCFAAAEHLDSGEPVNIGSDDEITILGLAKKIIAVTGSRSKIVHLPALKEGDMARRCPDIGKMNQLLNRPRTTLEEGIRKLMQLDKVPQESA